MASVALSELRFRGSEAPLAADARARDAAGNRNPFGDEQGALERFVAAVAAEPAARRNHAMARDVRAAAVAHDVADCAGRARPSGGGGHVAIGGHAAERNAAHRREHARSEWRVAIGHVADSVRSGRDHMSGIELLDV